MKKQFWVAVSILSAALCATPDAKGVEQLPSLEPILSEETAVPTAAPRVPPQISRQYAAKVRLEIEVKEHTKQLADGVTYTYWTFGDDAPGHFIRVREGDLIETTLMNHPDNTVAHNVDFHAATGPGGGGEASFVAPGHSATFTWRAMAPGLYLYHWGVFPPLAKSDFLMADTDRVIRVLLEGRSGTITVNGKNYQGAMPKLKLSDEQIAAVLTFVRTSFGNGGSPIDVAQVGRVRASLGSSTSAVQVAAEQQ